MNDNEIKKSVNAVQSNNSSIGKSRAKLFSEYDSDVSKDGIESEIPREYGKGFLLKFQQNDGK